VADKLTVTLHIDDDQCCGLRAEGSIVWISVWHGGHLALQLHRIFPRQFCPSRNIGWRDGEETMVLNFEVRVWCLLL